MKETRHPLNSRLSGPNSLSGRFGDKEYLLLMLRFDRGVSNP